VPVTGKTNVYGSVVHKVCNMHAIITNVPKCSTACIPLLRAQMYNFSKWDSSDI